MNGMRSLCVASLLLLSVVTAETKHDNLVCSNSDQVLHYPLGPNTHRVTISLDDRVSSDSRTGNNSIQQPCRVSLIGCDECRMEISIRDSKNHWDCSRVLLDGDMENGPEGALTLTSFNTRHTTCTNLCSYLLLYEPAYSDINVTYFRSAINNIFTFKSISSRVTIETCYKGGTKTQSPIEIEVSVKHKIKVFSGSVSNGIRSGSFTSPNFPRGYARQGEKYLYYINNTDRTGTIRVNFEDWDIGQNTRLLFYETRQETEYPLSVHYGYYFRPVLQTSGGTLLVVFEPDITSATFPTRSVNFGFRATFEFLEGSDKEDIIETDCGGHIRYVTGGTILYRASHWTSGSIHDCIWVVHKSSAFQQLQIHLWNMTLSTFEDDTSVTIKDGLTSLSEVSRVYTRANNSSIQVDNSTSAYPMDIFSNNKGFYIRLRGTLFQNDTFLFTFVSYNKPMNDSTQPQCWKANEYFCPGNFGMAGMCIDRHFLCDGHAHCPNGEDESSICNYAHVEPHSRNVILTPVCRPGEFRCLSGDRCAPSTAVCDEWRDCPDGSDEYYCDSSLSSSDYISIQCTNGTHLCENICVTDAEVCTDKRCVLIWYNIGCDIFGISEPVVRIEWSLILPLCFAIFCVIILLGILLIRLRRQPKFYVDPANRRVRSCRRVPIVSRVIRCHAACSTTSSCSGNSGMGLLSRSTSGASSALDSRTLSPSPIAHYLGSPSFDLSQSPTPLVSTSPCPSTVSQQEPNTFFNFDRMQTSVT